MTSLHIDPSKEIRFSYIDNVALSTSSLSYGTNLRVLQSAFGSIRPHASAREVGFYIPKLDSSTVERYFNETPQGSLQYLPYS